MANRQPTEAHLRIAHRINEQIMSSDFSKRQRKILDLILRLSWGCGKKEAFIPHKKDFEVVGVGEGHIKGELRWLQLAKVITISGNQYSFNENYDQWRVSRAKGYDPEKLTELVRINLSRKSKTYQNGKPNLPKWEDSTYQSGKNSTSEMAMAKEKLKKDKESVPSKDGAHKPKVSKHPLIAQMQRYLGFPEKTDKDPIPNPAKEAGFIKKMLARGFTRDDILTCWKSKVDRRGGEFVSMTWVNEDIGKKEFRRATETESPDAVAYRTKLD